MNDEINTIDEYIAQFPKETQKRLRKIRAVIRKAAPKAVEKISWGMPTFWQGKNLIHFAAMKNHIGLYPGAEGVVAFAKELEGYKTSKGAIQLPNDKELPLDLITRITGFRVQMETNVPPVRALQGKGADPLTVKKSSGKKAVK